MLGRLEIVDRESVRIHTYMAPDDSFNVTTHLIETPSLTVAVDAQFALGYAREVVDYATGLGKPIDRVIITHAHPDHYQGAMLFRAPIHALAAVRDQIVAAGDKQDPTGETIAVESFTPTVVVTAGSEVIDGVRFEFEAIAGGEAADQLVVRLPEQGVLIAQDLVYNRNHLFLGQNDIAGWKAALAALQAVDGYDVVLPGHGVPAGPAIFADMDQYLTQAAELLGDDGEAYKAAILDRYPDHGSAFLIDIANMYLFPDTGAH